MKFFFRYLYEKRRLIICWVFWIAMQAVVFALYNLPWEALLYASALGIAAGAVFMAFSFVRWRGRLRDLSILARQAGAEVLQLPEARTALESYYQVLCKALADRGAADRRKAQMQKTEMLDFYTLWVHQIKTPIAAMRLLLQSGGQPDRFTGPLSGELTRIEGYVSMVLSYLRLESEQTDYLFRKTRLDKQVRQAVRRFARLFIGGKLSVSADLPEVSVTTDSKWLSVVLEQVLSNAVKYTPPGGKVTVAFSGQTLTIADTGIGIREEDLPRVFERGYTGFNGHNEEHSSGLGLYLCRRIMEGLGGSIEIRSKVGEGTEVMLTFPEEVDCIE